MCLEHFGERMTIIPWETTLEPHLPWEFMEKSRLFELVLAKYRDEIKSEHLVLCDLVAAAAMVDPSLVEKQHTMGVRVLLQVGEDSGTILWDWYARSTATKVHVVERINREKFLWEIERQLLK